MSSEVLVQEKSENPGLHVGLGLDSYSKWLVKDSTQRLYKLHNTVTCHLLLSKSNDEKKLTT